MSNIYIQEPPTHGKVLLETTVGDIDIELWSREAPKACRNFVQLCMEGYYNGTIFHRLVKGFIVQGGDPTGTGTGGNSIYGKPFKDEFHSRLRFVRRGLVGMANAGKDDNGSQFFFTLDATPELQNKHTLFGKVTGNTIYNMIKLEESETNEDERPIYPHKIIGTKILLNPFEDIVPRQVIKRESKSKKEKIKETGTKNFKLLSFGEEAEEEEEEISVANKQYAGKSKSSHDLANDPKLSKELAVEPPPKKKRQQSGDSHSSADDSGADSGPQEQKKLSRRREDGEKESVSVDLSSIKEKLQRKSKAKPGKSTAGTVDADNDDGDYYLGKDEELAAKKRVDDLKKEYRELKSEMKKSERAKQVKEEADQDKVGKLSESSDNSYIREFVSQQKEYKTKTADAKKKGADREAQTLALLQKFQKKLVNVQEPDDAPRETVDDEDDVNDSNWFMKPLDYEGDEAVLAKDANLKSAEWYGLDDPRNPVVQRRRNEAKRIAASKNHRRDLI